MADVDISEFHVLLLIEWDGKKGSGTWYDFLHANGVWTRKGSREEYPSALARRYHQAKSREPIAISQNEGVYLCRSLDAANRIGNEAKRLGAQSVVIGTTFIRKMNIPEADKQAFDAMRQREMKRGRKAEDESGTYSLTCHAEAITVEVEAKSMPQICPSCGGHRLHAYMGTRPSYVLSPDDKKDVYDLWLRSRFDGSGKFVVPRFVKKGSNVLPVSQSVIVDMPDIKMPSNVPTDLDTQLRIYDAVYCLSHLLGEDYRRNMRLTAAMAWLNYCESEGRTDYDKWQSARPVGYYDLLDVTIVTEISGQEFARYL